MPNNPNAIDNLVYRQKGDPPLPGAGRPKGSRSLKTILREMLDLDPEEFLLVNEGDEKVKKLLKSRNIQSAKDLINYRLIASATNGNLDAIKAVYKESGEAEADILNVNFSVDIDKTLSTLSAEKLIALRNIVDTIETPDDAK